MKLYLVREDDDPRWVAALTNERMYGYVANTGKFHDNNALRNDYYIDRDFSYEEIGPGEARRLIDRGIGRLDEVEEAAMIAAWKADPRPLSVTDVLAMAAGSRN